MEAPADPEAAAITVESLVAEVLGHEVTRQEPVDWHRHGPELAAVLLRRRLDTPPADAGPLPELPAEAPGVSPDLACAVANLRLRAGLGLNTEFEPEVGRNGGTP